MFATRESISHHGSVAQQSAATNMFFSPVMDTMVQRTPNASVMQQAYEQTKQEIALQCLIAAFSPEKNIPELYLKLKKARRDFPQFDENTFLAIISLTKIYSDGMRKSVVSSYPKALQADDRKMIWRESQKPFAGYKVSGFDASSRFTTEERKKQLGYDTAPSHVDYKSMAKDPSTAQTSFAEADVLVFSGHQYAQYKLPGVFTNDDSQIVYDARTLNPPLNKVKVIISTSCATICKEPAAIWKSLFPNAVFLGYKKSAPLNGGLMARSFANRLPKDLILDGTGKMQAVQAWKSAIQAVHKGDSLTAAGWMDIAANTVEYWDGKAFHSISATSDENKCKEKGDYSTNIPDPGNWRGRP